MTDAVMENREYSLRAGEYVLRLLSAREERDFEDQLTGNPGLMAEVARWNRRFAGLDAEFQPVPPPRAVKAELMARLFGEETPRTLPFWQRLGLWQGVSLASLAVAGVFAWQVMQTQPGPVGMAPVYVSEVVAEDSSLRVLAVFDGATDQLRITRTAGGPDTGRVHELWAIAGDNAPVSLGVMPDDGRGAITLPQGVSQQGLVLAISDEPPGGSPTGQPTGAVLAVGQVVDL